MRKMYQISLKPRDKFDHWRNLAEYWQLSGGAKQRLEWIIFYHSFGKKNALETARYFGISRKTFHKWKGRFNPKVIQSLEEKSRSPKNKRVWTVTKDEEQKVTTLRLESKSKWGKRKLKREYLRVYGRVISTNKIQKIINKNKLYPDPVERKKKVKKQKSFLLKPKTRIHQFKKEFPNTIVWHVDTVQIWWYGSKRYIFTALEDKTKLAFGRVYETASSKQSTDFLKRLVYLTNDQMRVIHSDNGGEFAKEFEKACISLSIKQIYSRVKTPKDNPALERFNWTIQDEWLSVSEVGLDNTKDANQDLTLWLIKYNFQRPHQSLDYQTPIEYAQLKYPEVLPMYPARTFFSQSNV